MKPSVFRDPELPKALLPRYRRRVKEVEPLIAPRRVVTMYHERAERREREPRDFPTRSKHDRGIPRVEVGGVAEVRIGDRRTQFRKKFREQNDVVCFRDQAGKVQVSVWLFPSRVLQVDEIRDLRVCESVINFYQPFQ